MKPIILMLAFLFSSQSIANVAYIPLAERSAIGAYSSNSCFYTNNISDVDIYVTFTFFDDSGNVFTSPLLWPHNISAIGQPSLVRPNQRASFCFPSNAKFYTGHGKIDAVAVDGISRSVLATAHSTYFSTTQGHLFSVPINGGMPF